MAILKPRMKPWFAEFFRFVGGFTMILGGSLALLFVFQLVLS